MMYCILDSEKAEERIVLYTVEFKYVGMMR